MHHFITGGAGFIGSHLVDALLARGERVTVLDNLFRGREDYIKHNVGNANFRFVKGDVRDRKLVSSMLEGVDIVYHLAAVVGVKYYVDSPVDVIKVNTEGTALLLEECLNRKIERFVFASTSEIYGKNDKMPLAERSDRVLGDPSIDRWCYSTSKAIDEHMCFAYFRKHGLPVTVLRYFNAYGPRADNSDYGYVIPIFIKQVLGGQPPTVFGSGKQSRSFTYVSDSVEATMKAALEPRAKGEAFNIGSEREISIKQLAEKIVKCCGKKLRPKRVPYEKFYGKHYEDLMRRKPSISKAKHVLGWKPRVGIDEGLAKTIEYYGSK